MAVTGAIYATDQLGPWGAGFWHIDQWRDPAAQIASLPGMDTNTVGQDICAFSGQINNWEGEVETALLSGGGVERIFLAIKVAPNLILADAVRYDDVDNLVRKGTPVFNQAERLSTGMRVLISGKISPMPTLCRASFRDAGRYTWLLTPSRIEPSRSLLVTKRLWVEVLIWALLTSPILAFLYFGKLRTQIPETVKNTSITSIYATRKLSEGAKDVDVAKLLLTYRHHLDKGENEEAKLTLDVLEGVQPKDDAEWVMLSALFREAKRFTSERLISERHLAANPLHSNAQLRLVQLLGKSERRRAIELARSLLARDDLTEHQMLDIGAIFRDWNDKAMQMQAYRRLLDVHPSSLKGETQRLLLWSQMESCDDLNEAIKHFHKRIPELTHWYVICADLASRVKNVALFDDCVSHILGHMDVLDLGGNRQLVNAYLRLGRRQEAADAYLALDYSAISKEATLKQLLDLAEFFGFTDVGRLACRRLVEVAPTEQLRVKLSQLEFFAKS